MVFSFRFNEEKNQLLKATRGITFEEMLYQIEIGNLLADIAHPSQQRPNQRLYVVRMNEYVYAVPYVVSVQKQEIFLKTIFPSRALTKMYVQGGTQDEE